MPRSRVLTLVALAAYLVFVAAMTLGPQPIDDSDSGVLRTVLRWLARSPLTSWLDYGVVEFLGNIALFIPLGALLVAALGVRHWWAALLLAGACTILIETAQLGLPGRVSDPRDLVSNTIGSGIGILVIVWGVLGRGRGTSTDDVR